MKILVQKLLEIPVKKNEIPAQIQNNFKINYFYKS